MSDHLPHQTDHGDFVACGISVSSRDNRCTELAGLLLFADTCEHENVNQYVVSVFADTPHGICNLELKPEVKLGDPVANVIFRLACRHLPLQFVWLDDTVQGGDLSPPPNDVFYNRLRPSES